MSNNSTKSELIKSLSFRILGVGIGFITTAILIEKLGAASYGTWAALISLLAWVQISDFGVGNALKNRIAAARDPVKTLPLVASIFQFYVIMSVLIAVVFYQFGDVLLIVRQYKIEALVLYLGALIFFPLSIGLAVLQGLHKNSISSLMGLTQSLFWLASVLFLVSINPTLLWLALLYIWIILLVGLVQCMLGSHALAGSLIAPLKALFDFSNFRLALPLWGVGIRFLLLQLSSAILFTLGTYLTYSNLSPEDAAKYDILFKFYQMPLIFFNVIISVYWVEIARAIANRNKILLQKKFSELWILALGTVFLMLFFSIYIAPQLVGVYTGGKINVSSSDALAFWSLITVQIFAYSGAVFLNAAEKLHGQIVLAVVEAALLIPLVIFLYGRNWGFVAVPISTALLIFPSFIYCNLGAYYQVIKKAS